MRSSTRIARLLFAANTRVRLIKIPTVEGLRDAILADRQLREIDTTTKLDRFGMLRAVGVPVKQAWNAINAAEAMKRSRRNNLPKV